MYFCMYVCLYICKFIREHLRFISTSIISFHCSVVPSRRVDDGPNPALLTQRSIPPYCFLMKSNMVRIASSFLRSHSTGITSSASPALANCTFSSYTNIAYACIGGLYYNVIYMLYNH